MSSDMTVWHAVIRDPDGTLRCMDPGCGFNKRRAGAIDRDMRYHRASDLEPAIPAGVRADGPDRRVRPELVSK